MTDLLTWIQAHRVELLEAAGAGYVLLCLVVRITPTKRDDEALSAAHELVLRASVLAPRDTGRVLSLPGALPKRDPLGDRT